MWLIIGIIIAVFTGIVWLGGGKEPAEVASDAGGTPSVHSTGKRDATVKLVEYSDFQCPACGAYYPVVEQVIKKYKDQISFEYRHYPLTTIHRNAFAAARASEAAGQQGKFWDMYRLLFAHQSAWKDANNAASIFEGYAKQLGLDVPKFRADFASSKTNSAITASTAEFNRRGLPKATPTFLLNNKKIQPQNAEQFGKLIDAELQRAAAQ
jgi:protein-disulfide isomerase